MTKDVTSFTKRRYVIYTNKAQKARFNTKLHRNNNNKYSSNIPYMFANPDLIGICRKLILIIFLNFSQFVVN